jgi:hypothetical protein
VDKAGLIAIDPFYDDVAGFSEGLAAAESEGKIGFIDKNGRWQIKPQYDYVDGFSDGLALVWADKERFYVDKNGKVAIKLDRTHNQSTLQPRGVSESGLRVRLNSDFSGGFQQVFASPSCFSEGLAAMPLDGKFGYMDKSGKFLIAPTFDDAFPFANGLARVKTGGKYGFIDKTGKMAVEPKFLGAHEFKEGAAAVAVGQNKWGFIDSKGNFLLEPKYSFAWSFSEGLAQVQFWGYIDDGISAKQN